MASPLSRYAGHLLHCRAATPDEVNASITFQYVAEGSANIVFSIVQYHPATSHLGVGHRFVLHDGTSAPPLNKRQFHGCVIRLSKGLPKTSSAHEVKQDFDAAIAPLFPTTTPNRFAQHIMDMVEVTLDKAAILFLNTMLSLSPSRFHGTLPDNSTCLLMEDMRSGIKNDTLISLSIEMKPKWLAQSPDSPKRATRCRNCAMQAYRNNKNNTNATPPYYICPMHFLHGTRDVVESWLMDQVDDALKNFPGANRNTLDGANRIHLRNQFFNYLFPGAEGGNLLSHLRRLQILHDQKGVLSKSTDNDTTERLRMAMTLRDCSLFLKAEGRHPLQPMHVTQGKLVDLDYKSAAKIPDWVLKESALVSGNWYVGRGTVGWRHGGCGLHPAG